MSDSTLSAVSTMLADPAPAAPVAPAAPAAGTPPVDGAPAAVDPAAPATTDAPEAPAPLVMPGKDATPEQWAEFYGKIGRPESPDAYEMEVPEGDDGTFAKAVAPLLHKAGITGDQAKVLSQGWNQMKVDAEAQMAAAEAAAAQAQHVKNTAEAEALKTEWGQQFDSNMHHAKIAVQQFLPKEGASDIIGAIESKIGYKATIQFLHNIGTRLGEHDAAGLGQQTSGASKRSIEDRLYGGKES